MDINQKITEELGVKKWQVDAAVKLIDEGKTTRKQFEVDFVVNQGSQRYYIQVAYDMTSEEKQDAKEEDSTLKLEAIEPDKNAH